MLLKCYLERPKLYKPTNEKVPYDNFSFAMDSMGVSWAGLFHFHLFSLNPYSQHTVEVTGKKEIVAELE